MTCPDFLFGLGTTLLQLSSHSGEVLGRHVNLQVVVCDDMNRQRVGQHGFMFRVQQGPEKARMVRRNSRADGGNQTGNLG